jgi:hypothetical protein
MCATNQHPRAAPGRIVWSSRRFEIAVRAATHHKDYVAGSRVAHLTKHPEEPTRTRHRRGRSGDIEVQPHGVGGISFPLFVGSEGRYIDEQVMLGFGQIQAEILTDHRSPSVLIQHVVDRRGLVTVERDDVGQLRRPRQSC